jgi:hypothetical protein
LYREALNKFPNLEVFDNGYTGVGGASAYFPRVPYLYGAVRASQTLRTLRLATLPNSADWVAFLASTPSLEQLAVDVLPMDFEKNDVAKWNRPLHAMVDLPQLHFLSITSTGAARMLKQCRFWRTGNLKSVVIRATDFLEGALEEFFQDHGRKVTYLEIDAPWKSGDVLNLSTFCPELQTLAMAWDKGFPDVLPHSRLHEVFLQALRRPFAEVTTSAQWPPCKWLRSLGPNAHAWPSMERVTDLTIDGFWKSKIQNMWVNEILPQLKGTDIVGYGQNQLLIKDLVEYQHGLGGGKVPALEWKWKIANSAV